MNSLRQPSEKEWGNRQIAQALVKRLGHAALGVGEVYLGLCVAAVGVVTINAWAVLGGGAMMAGGCMEVADGGIRGLPYAETDEPATATRALGNFAVGAVEAIAAVSATVLSVPVGNVAGVVAGAGFAVMAVNRFVDGYNDMRELMASSAQNTPSQI